MEARQRLGYEQRRRDWIDEVLAWASSWGATAYPCSTPFAEGEGLGWEEQSGGQIGRHFLIRLPLELVRPVGEMWLVSSGLGELEPLGLRAMALDLLRASLPVGGRALTLYEEVHPQKKLANRDVQHRFLQRLAQRLPAEAAPIIVADSGFKVPFYREVERLGWRSRRTMEKQPFAIDALGILPDRQPDCFSEESAVTI